MVLAIVFQQFIDAFLPFSVTALCAICQRFHRVPKSGRDVIVFISPD